MLTTLGLSPRRTTEVLESAVRAPSVHNTQPWGLAVHEDRIELFADYGRRLHFTDPTDKGLMLSCGAVVTNLRLALGVAGIRPLVTLYPSTPIGGPVATVRHGGFQPADEATRRLHAAIAARRTNRRPFLDEPVDEADRAALVSAAQSERCWLHVMGGRERVELRHLIGEAHLEQERLDGYLAEFGHWTGRDAGARDGVLTETAGPLPEPQDEWVLRDFSGRRGRSRVEGKDFEPDPLVVTLCSFYDGRLAELTAGQALQRVLLAATERGLAASFLSQPLEVTRTAKALRQLVGGSLIPQAVLRIGHGHPAAASPRRPLVEMLLPLPITT